MPITHQGIDYESGGLYVIGKNGEEIDIDAQMKPGDVFFYDGKYQHGVKKIESKQGIGHLQVFAIPTFFEYPLSCLRLKQEINLAEVVSYKLKSGAKQLLRSAKNLVKAKN